ncbi:MAG: hypothetical protein K2Q06_13180 [Parvularculaceae bacterium]|nr:hypothetical protein [Parvularculaceae bacterium]
MARKGESPKNMIVRSIGPMEFRQKNRSTRLRFTFDRAELTYHIIDQSGEVELLIDYAELPGTSRRVFKQVKLMRNLGILFCVLSLIMAASAAAGATSWASAATFFIMGMSWFVVYVWNLANYTVLDTVKGSVLIIEDKQLDAIYGEMKSRRKARLLDLHGQVDPTRDPNIEIAKFEWLVKERVLTREEADAVISRLRQPDPETSPRALLN